MNEDKTSIRQRLNYSFSWKTRLGKVMTVVYDPKNPSDIDSNPGFNLIVLPRVVTAVGVTGLIAAALEYLEVIHVFGWSS